MVPGDGRAAVQHLLDPDHHRVRADQVLDVALAEARVGHPGAAVRTRVVEPDGPSISMLRLIRSPKALARRSSSMIAS